MEEASNLNPVETSQSSNSPSHTVEQPAELATATAGTKINYDLWRLRFDFAWSHFAFHAQQRTTMLQYFAAAVPLITGGYFYFLKERPLELLPEALAVIAGIGAVLSFVFGLLDIRNRHLFEISETNLKLLEKHILYPVPLDAFEGIMRTEEAM